MITAVPLKDIQEKTLSDRTGGTSTTIKAVKRGTSSKTHYRGIEKTSLIGMDAKRGTLKNSFFENRTYI